ncbi:hypothetical protein WR25_17939 [Diploscapter pachys]|uniref:Uncharacterized protein n=1 Tax=Diploscapter pachys TaxID=2018661 RepID=A0A2A2LCI0_9BILA|nr:hypothetical protein WR25_17939 [Diploscapter pachys]
MANLRTDDIDHVIMVGGSTRIPAIRGILEMKFGQEKLRLNINPGEAVVFGAAILADAIELLMDGEVERYIDYQTMNGNGLKSERFQEYEALLESHR